MNYILHMLVIIGRGHWWDSTDSIDIQYSSLHQSTFKCLQRDYSSLCPSIQKKTYSHSDKSQTWIPKRTNCTRWRACKLMQQNGKFHFTLTKLILTHISCWDFSFWTSTRKLSNLLLWRIVFLSLPLYFWRTEQTSQICCLIQAQIFAIVLNSWCSSLLKVVPTVIVWFTQCWYSAGHLLRELYQCVPPVNIILAPKLWK